jgi:ZIP family zinc transporter
MIRRLLLWCAPLALLGLVLALIAWGPTAGLQDDALPAVERLTFQRVTLEPGLIVANVLNDGSGPVTIAQVQVDDAFWMFSADDGATLKHLGSTGLRIPYPWVRGETHHLRILTSSGTAFEHEIPVAVETPTADARFLGAFTLIGVYVGVLPVAIGLLWFPMIRRLSAGSLQFFLALTVGLLVFLLVDGASEGLEAASGLPESFQGVVLFALSAIGAYLCLESVGRWLKSQTPNPDRQRSGWVLAVMVAVGIGLHNFGEGLAIGSAYSLGEAALGTLLVVGFALHNTTEGLAIVAPLARDEQQPSATDLARLGFIGGVPTIAGVWLGGFVYSDVWAVILLALGVGAIAQVAVQITRHMARGQSTESVLATAPVLAGFATGFAVMYATGMLLG